MWILSFDQFQLHFHNWKGSDEFSLFILEKEFPKILKLIFHRFFDENMSVFVKQFCETHKRNDRLKYWSSLSKMMSIEIKNCISNAIKMQLHEWIRERCKSHFPDTNQNLCHSFFRHIEIIQLKTMTINTFWVRPLTSNILIRCRICMYVLWLKMQINKITKATAAEKKIVIEVFVLKPIHRLSIRH